VRRLAARYTYVLIDLPPAADLATRTALLTADMAIVPLPLEEESLDDVPKVLELIRAVREGSDSALRTLLFLTLARDSDAARRIEATLRGRYGDLILRTRIPEDPGLNALLDGQPRAGLPSAGVNAYHQLANELAHRVSAAAAS
jgi:chromosome partitioning protein